MGSTGPMVRIGRRLAGRRPAPCAIARGQSKTTMPKNVVNHVPMQSPRSLRINSRAFRPPTPLAYDGPSSNRQILGRRHIRINGLIGDNELDN